MTEAYDEGYEAAIHGRDFGDNPYRCDEENFDTEDAYYDWYRGWSDGFYQFSGERV